MKEKINVLMIVSWYSPHDAETMSAGIFHYEQSMSLKKYCNVALYYPFDINLKEDFLIAQEKGLLTFRRKVTDNKIAKYIHYISDYIKICRKFKPDIIHAHVALQAGRVGVALGKIFRTPVVVTEHTPIEWSGIDNPVDKKRTKKVYDTTRMNVCVSNDSMNKLQNVFPEADFQVIYNGVIDPFDIKTKNTKYSIDGAINCCIVAAFYDKEVKGYQFLIPAIKKLVDEGIKIVLHICGGGTYLDYYKKMADELHLQNNIIFYGQCDREKVYTIVKQMDFNISSSLFECSGVSVQEAMLLGKPLVVTKSGGANSLVTEETAIVVEKESCEAIVRGIKEMISNLDKFNSTNIRQYAFENFEIDHVSKKYLELYKSLVN